MGYPYANQIRRHAFQTIHFFDDYDQFEAEMITFGESLPPVESPTAKDPHYRFGCRSTARWAWQRRDTIVQYDRFLEGERIQRPDDTPPKQ